MRGYFNFFLLFGDDRLDQIRALRAVEFIACNRKSTRSNSLSPLIGPGEPVITYSGITESGIMESGIIWEIGNGYNGKWYNGIR